MTQYPPVRRWTLQSVAHRGTTGCVKEQLQNKLNAALPIVAPLPIPPSRAEGITRGTSLLLRDMDFEMLTEFKLSSRRRADLAGLDRQGRLVIVEVKSSLADFRTDKKWPEYLTHCDLFYFAVGDDFPLEKLPDDEGLIIADAFHGTIHRPATERQPPARAIAEVRSNRGSPVGTNAGPTHPLRRGGLSRKNEAPRRAGAAIAGRLSHGLSIHQPSARTPARDGLL